jgi:hypothetical protein
MPKLIYHDSDGVDKSFNLTSDPVLIGRANEAQIQTQDAMVSRRHARIVWDGGYWIEDLGSSNGVYVGHEKVQRAPFRPGDVVTCGSLVMRMIPDTVRPSTTNVPAQNLNNASTGPAQVVGQQSKPPPRTQALDAPQPQQPAYQPPQPAYQPAPAPAYQQPPQPYQPPQPAYQPAPAPAYQQQAPQPAYQAPQPAPSSGPDFAAERKRREEAEAALLTAADRVKVAERRVAELESQLAAAQRAPAGGDSSEELTKLRRQVEQLTADNRRMRGGQMPGSDASKINELTDQLRKAQEELRNKPAGGAVDPAAADAAIALGDALAELRSSLRAASDEATVLTSPPTSVGVVAEALGQATEQLERARASLRSLGRFLGVA